MDPGTRVGEALSTRPKYVASTTLTDLRARWVLPEPLQLDRLQPEPQVEGDVAVVDHPSNPSAVSSNLTGRALTRNYAAKP